MTFSSEPIGQALVKGVVMTLSLIGLSVKPGGSAREVEITGGHQTNGTGPYLLSSSTAQSNRFELSVSASPPGGRFDKI